MNTIILIISIYFNVNGYKQVKVTKKGEVIARFASGEAHVDFFKARVWGILYDKDVFVMSSSSCSEFVTMANSGYFGETRYEWIETDIGELFIPKLGGVE